LTTGRSDAASNAKPGGDEAAGLIEERNIAVNDGKLTARARGVQPTDFKHYQYPGSDYVLMPIPQSGIPRRKGWNVKPWKQADIIERAVWDNVNLAVRLAGNQMVISVPDDYDFNLFTKPRSESVFPDMYPAVRAGKDRTHYYCRLPNPDDRDAMWHLRRDFPELRFITKGRFVIAAGSFAPEPDAWLYDNPLKDAPEIFL